MPKTLVAPSKRFRNSGKSLKFQSYTSYAYFRPQKQYNCFCEGLDDEYSHELKDDYQKTYGNCTVIEKNLRVTTTRDYDFESTFEHIEQASLSPI